MDTLTLNEKPYSDTSKSAVFKIALVGMGPKGLYGLERLLAHLSKIQTRSRIEIHLFNKTSYLGCGDVYRVDQPDYLLMNYSNGFIDMWDTTGPKPIVADPMPFVDWINRKYNKRTDSSVCHSFSSRATVGNYLREGFEKLVEACPDHISLESHVGEVIGIKREYTQFLLSFESKLGEAMELDRIDEVLLATGHLTSFSDVPYDTRPYIDFIYPISNKLGSIHPASSVAIKGMGLTFIDAVLGLTEGKGGEFRLGAGELVYTSSGHEPSKIYPFSTSGLPMFPRGSTYGRVRKELKYFSAENLDIDIHHPPKRKINFQLELLPNIHKELIFSYYECLFRKEGKLLVYFPDFPEVENQIRDFHVAHPEAQRFDFKDFFPIAETSQAELNRTLQETISKWIRAAEEGEDANPLAAAAGVWRSISELFNRLFSFGGLTPDSHSLFASFYANHFNRIAYGPPVITMKKMLALAKAGILDFSYCHAPVVEYAEDIRKYRLSLASQTPVSVDYLVNARIPRYNVSDHPSPLFANLITNGLARPYINQEAEQAFCPGCIELNRNGNPVDYEGNPVLQITLTGTPTEGITFDNDTLSRKRNDFVSAWAARVADTLTKRIDSLNEKLIIK